MGAVGEAAMIRGMTSPNAESLLPGVLKLVDAASAAILAVYASGTDVELKADDSPITQADRAAHRILADGLPHARGRHPGAVRGSRGRARL